MAASAARRARDVNLYALLHPVRHHGLALALLLVLCTVLATVSVLQAHQLGADDDPDRTGEAIDTRAAMRRIVRRLDEMRGLEALHLVVKSDAEKRALESDLDAQRRAIDRLLAATPPLPGDPADRELRAAVRTDTAAYWAAQQQLLALSRQADVDTAGTAAVQQLLRASQTRSDRLHERLDAWWTHRETRARDEAAMQRSGVAQLLFAIALLGFAAAGAGFGRMRRAPAHRRAPRSDTAAPDRVAAFQSLIDAARAPRGDSPAVDPKVAARAD